MRGPGRGPGMGGPAMKEGRAVGPSGAGRARTAQMECSAAAAERSLMSGESITSTPTAPPH
eukprot:5507269-Prymnesium_polylepis.1